MYVELVLILVQFNSKCLDTSRPAVKMMSSKMDWKDDLESRRFYFFRMTLWGEVLPYCQFHSKNLEPDPLAVCISDSTGPVKLRKSSQGPLKILKITKVQGQNFRELQY